MLDVKNWGQDATNSRVISRETEPMVLMCSPFPSVCGVQQLWCTDHFLVLWGPTLYLHIRQRLGPLLYCGIICFDHVM